jgi:hypothetical protein
MMTTIVMTTLVIVTRLRQVCADECRTGQCQYRNKLFHCLPPGEVANRFLWFILCVKRFNRFFIVLLFMWRLAESV